jgi:hypothetical protein
MGLKATGCFGGFEGAIKKDERGGGAWTNYIHRQQ